MKAKIKLLTVVTLPHIEMSSSPARQIFLLDITQGLKFHPYVKTRLPAILDLFLGGEISHLEFCLLVKVLTDYKIANSAKGSTALPRSSATV